MKVDGADLGVGVTHARLQRRLAGARVGRQGVCGVPKVVPNHPLVARGFGVQWAIALGALVMLGYAWYAFTRAPLRELATPNAHNA